MLTVWCVVLLCGASAVVSDATNRPNVVFIMADDLGWNDVSYHGSDQILTPNIDALAYSGVALHNYYTYPTCTPSRAAFLTGKYAHKIGMQGLPVVHAEDRGIPVTEKLISSYLKDLGYKTHLIGKWHVGASRPSYLPTNRGFDSHFGYRGGDIDYYEYFSQETVPRNWSTVPVSGFDLFRNTTPALDVRGYLTDLFTREAVNVIKSHDTSAPLFMFVSHAAPHAGTAPAALQAPPAAVRLNRHVRLPARRMLAGMMTRLDESVGDVVKALANRNMLNNTLIVFVSDNGADTEGGTQNYGSNYPLRGMKFRPYEGAIRVSGVVWSPKILKPAVWPGTMHVTDWLPTILSAVNGSASQNIDGIDQWNNIIQGKESSRKNITLDINDFDGYVAVRAGDYKLVYGNMQQFYGRHLSGDMLEILGKAPNYTQILTNSSVYKVMSKLGRNIEISTVQSFRDQMQINCTGVKNDTELCVPSSEKVCLYNIKEDPCEYTDITSSHVNLANELLRFLSDEWDRRAPRQLPVYKDPLSDPKLHDGLWLPWLESISA